MLLELRVARAWQVPPTKLRDWSQEDRAMAAALLVHEADLGECGYPHRLTTDPEFDGYIEVDKDAEPKVCTVCASLARHRDAGGKPEPGAVIPIVDHRRDPHPDDDE